mgnify:CR=1 FL=1
MLADLTILDWQHEFEQILALPTDSTEQKLHKAIALKKLSEQFCEGITIRLSLIFLTNGCKHHASVFLLNSGLTPCPSMHVCAIPFCF